MNTSFSLKHLALNAIAALCMLATVGHACTGISVTGADGTRVFARTLEWGTFDLQSDVLVLPRGAKLSAHDMPNGAFGQSWTATYGTAGIAVLGKTIFGDAMNEKGLLVGTFFLPGFTENQPFQPQKASEFMAGSDLPTYLATQFATVAEVRAGLNDIRVVPIVEEAIGFPAPLHFL